MKTGSSIEINESDDYEKIELCPYQHLIGKLIYFAYKTRLDITFIVGQLSKYNFDSRKGHLQVAKRIVQYLKGTMQLGLIYDKKSDGVSPRDPPLYYELIKYTDNNFVGNPKK